MTTVVNQTAANMQYGIWEHKQGVSTDLLCVLYLYYSVSV